MNPDFPMTPREELEARLTALLLGELPAAEAASLQQALTQDSELAALYARLKPTIELVRETAPNPAEETAAQPAALRLSDERRQELLQQFKTVRPKEFARHRPSLTLLEVAAVLAILGVLAALTLPTLSRGKYKSLARNSATAEMDTEVSLEKAHAAAKYGLEQARSAAGSGNSQKPPGQAEGGVRTVTVVGYAPKPVASQNTYSRAFGLEPAKGQPTATAAAQPSPASKPAGSSIVLPPTDNWFAKEKFAATDGAAGQFVTGLTHEDVGGLRPLRLPAAGAPEVAGRPVVADNSRVAGEPDWVGTLSAPDKAPNTENRFAGRYSYSVAPSSSPEVAAATSPGTETSRSKELAFGKDVAGHWSLGDGKAPNTITLGAAEQSHRAFGAGVISRPDQSQKAVPVVGDVPALGRLFRSEQRGKEGEAPVVGAKTATPSTTVAGDAFAFTPAKPEAPLSAGVPIAPEERVRSVPAQRSPMDLATVDVRVSTNFLNSGAITAADAKQNNLALAQESANGFSPSNPQRPWDASATLRGYYDDSAQWNFGTGNANRPPAVRAKGDQGGAALGLEVAQAQRKATEIRTVTPGFDFGAVAKTSEEQNRQLHEAQAKVEDLRKQPLLSDSLVNAAAPTTLFSGESLRRVESLRQEAKAELGREETTLKEVSKLGPDQLAVALPTAVNDGRLTSLLEQKTLLDQKLAAAGKPSSPNAAELKALQSARDNLNQKIGERAQEVVQGMSAKLEFQRKYVADLDKEVDRALSNDSARASQSRPYFEAKRRLEELQRSAQGLSGDENGRSRTGSLVITGRGRQQILSEAGQTKDSDAAKKTRAAASAPIPQPEILTCDNAFSTFSLNVSDVSFKLAAASLEKGVLPEPASVRSEEFINAFDYRDPEAPAGVPVAFAWERAAYPFAQNRDLLRFSLKTAAAGRQAGRPLNIVLLLDNSGSMERADRVRIIREALRVLAAQLQPQDKFSIVTFARTARLWVDGVPGNEAAKAAEVVANLNPEGGTNLEEAMNLAYQTALRHYLPTGINRVVLLTDGAANLGEVEPESLKQKVETNRKQGIALDCFGIGWEGYNDDLLEVLSRNGDGRYGFVNTPEEASTEFAAQLAGALHVAASDVKVQVEFNPNRVTAYRQIGYAKHQLTKEQFRDNTVDAAELGAAEAGNALYVVEVNPRGEGPLATVRIRYKVPGTTDYREQEWPVPYTGNAVTLEQASPALRLAATASAFSEWLVSSPYAADITPERLLGYLGGVPEVYGADPRPRKLEWMVRQAQSLAGK